MCHNRKNKFGHHFEPQSTFFRPGTKYIVNLIVRTIINSFSYNLNIPVNRRVKGYTRLVEKYLTGRRRRFRPHKLL